MLDFKQITSKGIFWTAAAAAVQALGLLVQLLLLSKLLGPERYGEAVLAMLLIRVLAPLSAAGISTVVVQEPNLTGVQYSSLYWTNILFSFVVYVCLFVLAPFFATFFDIKNSVLLLRFGGLMIVFAAFGNLYAALLQKKLAFKKSSTLLIISILADILISISITLYDVSLGIWAIMLGFLVRTIVATCLQIHFGKRYFQLQYLFDWNAIRPIVKKSAYDMGAQFTNMLCVNMDNFLVAKYFGIANLGIYALAWDLAIKPVYAILPVIMKVKFALWSNMKTNLTALAADYEQTVSNIMRLMCCLLGAWFLASPYLIAVWYGEKWLSAIPYLQILLILSLARSFGSPSTSLALSLGFFKEEFYLTLFQLLLYSILLPTVIFMTNSMTAFCYAMLFGYLISDLVWYTFLHKNSPVSFVRLGKKVFQMIIIAILGVYFIIKI